MEGFTIIDGVVALVIVLSALLAYGRGLVRELMAIVGWIAAAVLAFLFAPRIEPLVREIPYIGEWLADNCEMSIVLAFFIVVAAVLIIASLFTPLFSSIVQRSVLGGLDQGLGFLFGVVRGILLVAVGFFVYSIVVTPGEITMVDDSRSAKVFGQFTTQIEERNPEEALGWIEARFVELVGTCGAS